MKKSIARRGLYRKVTNTPETEAEQQEVLESLALGVERYIGDAERVAGDILTKAGIEPGTLFDVVETDNGWYVRYAKVERKDLAIEADQALEVMWYCHETKKSLNDKKGRDGLTLGIRLAQAVDHLNANRAYLKPVKAGVGTISGGRKGAEATHGKPGSKAEQYRSAYLERRKSHPGETHKQAQKVVAKDFGLMAKNSYKTIERAMKGL